MFTREKFNNWSWSGRLVSVEAPKDSRLVVIGKTQGIKDSSNWDRGYLIAITPFDHFSSFYWYPFWFYTNCHMYSQLLSIADAVDHLKRTLSICVQPSTYRKIKIKETFIFMKSNNRVFTTRIFKVFSWWFWNLIKLFKNFISSTYISSHSFQEHSQSWYIQFTDQIGLLNLWTIERVESQP